MNPRDPKYHHEFWRSQLDPGTDRQLHVHNEENPFLQDDALTGTDGLTELSSSRP